MADERDELAPFLELLAKHPPRDCETLACDAPAVEPRLGMMDGETSNGIDAAIFECVCGWKRWEPLKLP